VLKLCKVQKNNSGGKIFQWVQNCKREIYSTLAKTHPLISDFNFTFKTMIFITFKSFLRLSRDGFFETFKNYGFFNYLANTVKAWVVTYVSRKILMLLYGLALKKEIILRRCYISILRRCIMKFRETTTYTCVILLTEKKKLLQLLFNWL
jgi:hypothetical protein